MNQKNSQVLITVVIPTRERALTLKHTLLTVLNQNTNNYQILICDNDSKDETYKVVNSFVDQRLTYINTKRRLSMCDNWDFALNYVKGEFVIFIGDDDALMPNAIVSEPRFRRFSSSLHVSSS